MKKLLATLAVVVGFGVFGGHGVDAIQGDQVGPDNHESRENYHARAQRRLESATQDAYALVSFAYPLTPQQAARAMEGVGRVDALYAQATGLVDLPEPTAGEGRAEVFARGLAAKSPTIEAVVIYGAPETLREVARRDGVWAVEPAPAGAAWNSFSIRPALSYNHEKMD